ncbi:hypothetical protein FB547_10578 [Variovorax beijingensis]|jgi:hypothetical protein|nr:hypothetical protein FB547_10578 [Variovorax beijingensis]
MPFACASILSFLAYRTLSASEWYYVWLWLLTGLSAVLAARLLWQAGFKCAAAAGTTIGLLVGQWWLVEALILRAFWRINGFAP